MVSGISDLSHLKDVVVPSSHVAPVTEKGDVVYSEVVRENVHRLEVYVEEMASGDATSAPTTIQKIQNDVLKLWNVLEPEPDMSEE